MAGSEAAAEEEEEDEFDSESGADLGTLVQELFLERSEMQVPMKNLERELLCPACEELFIHPIILPCQHSVCHRCAKELLWRRDCSFSGAPPEASTEPASPDASPALSPRRRSLRGGIPSVERLQNALHAESLVNLTCAPPRSSRPGARSTCFPCPTCERDIDLGPRGIAGLFRNFTLETIVERFRQAARAATAVMCDLCYPPPGEATKSCLDCRKSYCNECFKVHHPWNTPRATHEYIGPTTNFRPKVLMCPEHEAEKVNMYCEVCRRPVCHLCKMGGSHANHKVTNINSAYKTLKEKMTKSINLLLNQEDQVKEQIGVIENLIEQTETGGELASRGVSEALGGLEEALRVRRESMSRRLEGGRDDVARRLRTQHTECQQLLQSSGLVGLAREVLKETNPSCFMQAAKLLHSRIVEATERFKAFEPHVVDGSFSEFSVDVTHERALLGSLDFLKAPEVPVLDPSRSAVYADARVSWSLSEASARADQFQLEFRSPQRHHPSPVPDRHSVDPDLDDTGWSRVDGIRGMSHVLKEVRSGTDLIVRVRAVNAAGASEFSPELMMAVPPAPVFSFLLDDDCGYEHERLVLSPHRVSVDSVIGMSMLLASEGLAGGGTGGGTGGSPGGGGGDNGGIDGGNDVGSLAPMSFIAGDAAVSSGRQFWVVRVRPYSFLVRVGVATPVALRCWLCRAGAASGRGGSGGSGVKDTAVAAARGKGIREKPETPATPSGAPPWAFVSVGMGQVVAPSWAKLPAQPPSSPSKGTIRATPLSSSSPTSQQPARTSSARSQRSTKPLARSASATKSTPGTPRRNVGSGRNPRVTALPARLGVCLDHVAGTVAFYDADGGGAGGGMTQLCEMSVDCSGPVFPLFGFAGAGGLELEVADGGGYANNPAGGATSYGSGSGKREGPAKSVLGRRAVNGV